MSGTDYWPDAMGFGKTERENLHKALIAARKRSDWPGGQVNRNFYEEVKPFIIEHKARYPSHGISVVYDVDSYQEEATRTLGDIRNPRRGGKKYLAPYLAWLWKYHSDIAEGFYDSINLPYRHYVETDIEASSVETSPVQQERDPVAVRLRIEKGMGPTDRRFWAEALDIVGRWDERAALAQFLQPDVPGFSWLQLSGAGGQGKSRLALELCTKAKKSESGFNAGFLNSDALSDLESTWWDWLPSRPTLIVVDYVIGHERVLGRMMRTLARRHEELANSVRLLILERQPWNVCDSVQAAMLTSSREPLSISGGPDAAQWFISVSGTVDGHSALLDELRFKDVGQSNDSSIELKALSEDELTTLVRTRVAAISQDGASPVIGVDIAETLARIDKDGRPLYAYLLADALAAGEETADWEHTDLLRATLQRERKTRWAPAFSNSPPRIDAITPSVDLAILATLTRSLDTKALLGRDNWADIGDDDVAKSRVILDQPQTDDLVGSDAPLTALEPDILGTYFVLTALSRGTSGKQHEQRNARLIQTAWRIAPNAYNAFVLRAMQDFPQHPAIEELLLHTPPTIADCIDDPKTLFTLFSHLCLTNRESLFQQIFPRLLASAGCGASTSEFLVGLMYATGLGVPQNDEKAVSWLWAAAEQRSSVALRELTAMLLDCRGVSSNSGLYEFSSLPHEEQKEAVEHLLTGLYLQEHPRGENNEALAVNYLRKAADLGHGVAQFLLGMAYFEGHGIDQDDSEAFLWFRLAVKQGSRYGALALAGMLRAGRGVVQDDVASVGWYRFAAEQGSAVAQLGLAEMYWSGRGVAQSDAESAKWYLLAADQGLAEAQFNVSTLYALGRGVPKDVTRVVRWLRLAAANGHKIAQSTLVDVRASLGLPQDND